jgi:hypothetical protein
MFQSLRQLTGYAVHTQDGEAVGAVSNFLFDDLRWIVGIWFLTAARIFKLKRVLLSPVVFGEPDPESEVFPVQLDADEIAQSPNIGEIDPITRDRKLEIHEFYHWPAYWEEAHEVPP